MIKILNLKNKLTQWTILYHEKLWRPFIRLIWQYKFGKFCVNIARIFFRILWVFNITAPPKGEGSCFIYIFIRYSNKYNRLTFKEKITYLRGFIKRVWRTDLKS